VSWAIVIGVDDYGDGPPRLYSAVDDAETFHEWVTSESGGGVPCENVRLLLGRAADGPEPDKEKPVPTKDNVIAAINDVMVVSGGVGERLFFFFSGHGITATYASREESALVLPGYDSRHPDQTLAVRSIAEFFETTQFADQFFFIDACRTALPPSKAEIGAWPIPRRRNPGQPPVQQFIFYATSPGLTALAAPWPEELSAFTKVLMCGLKGEGSAKAWSWERNCYEVRWERLATYVKDEMELKRLPTERAADVPPDGWPFQIPQDAGTRGVAKRDRDARLVSLPSRGVKPVVLTIELKADPSYDEAEVNVLDANSEPVATALKVTGTSHQFTLPPKTYAVSATTIDERFGRLVAPVELYDDCTTELKLGPGAPDTGDGLDGTIEIRSPDPLAVADIRDETGQVRGVGRAGTEYKGPAGFYRVRHLGPEAEKAGEEQFVVLGGGQREPVELAAAAPDAHACALAKALGGGSEKDYVIPVPGAGPVAWAQPSTIIAAGIGAALHAPEALKGLGLESPLAELGEHRSGVALYAVAGAGDSAALENLTIRVWPSGVPVPEETTRLAPKKAGVAAVVTPTDEPQPHWLSIEPPKDAEPTVVALPGLPGRLATVIAQVDPDRVRLYQLHPVAGPAESSKPDRLRRVEHLERLLLGGRVDGAETLAEEVAAEARDDPFAGCLAGYVLLRLGRYERLGDLASDIVAVAPKLSDAFILRGEYEAHGQNLPAANQAFAEAVSAGVPAFGEGLTRLVEGLRVSGFNHPRGSLVRYIFQRHARGSMWAAFTPRRKLEPGRLVITGADIGFEG
jgi:Caspase domain